MTEVDATARLVSAVLEGDETSVKAALDAGANSNFLFPKDDSNCPGGTLLLMAVLKEHAHLIPVLVKAGVPLNGQGAIGYTPLHAAAAYGKASMIPELVSHGADLDVLASGGFAFTAMHFAAYRGDEASIAALLSAGANIDAQSPRNFTPLHTAAQHGHLHIIRLLIDSGCNRHARSSTGMTALHMAAMQGLKEVAKVLLKYGLDPEAKDENEHTPETCADVWGMNDIRWWFSKRQDSSPTLVPEKKLHADSQDVYEFDHGKLIKIIQLEEWLTLHDVIPRTRDGHYQNSRGQTVLHMAASLGHLETVTTLMERCGVYPGVVTHRGVTAAEMARQAGHLQVADVLMKAMRPHQSSKSLEELYGELLSEISSGDDVKKACALVKAGAPLEPTGEYSTHALALAITSNRPRIVSFLLAAGAPANTTLHRLNLVQVAWLSPDVTAMVRMIVTRHMEYVLQEEKEVCELTEIRDGIDSLLNALKSQTPWKAAWPKQASGKPQQQQFLTSLLVEATRVNCPMTAFFLQQAGALSYGVDAVTEVSPIVAAVDAGHSRLIDHLVKTTGCLYIKDDSGKLPRDLLSSPRLQELEKMIYEQERRILSRQEELVKDKEEKEVIRKIQDLQFQLFKVFVSGDGQFQGPTYKREFLKTTLLVASQLGLVQLSFILVMTGGLSVDEEVDSLTGTTALHQAAAYGHKNLVAMLRSLGANLNQRDISGHTPAHLAAMFGHSLTYQKLCLLTKKKEAVCNAGTTPSQIRKNFIHCLTKYHKADKEEELPDSNDPTKVFQKHINSLTVNKLLELTSEVSVDYGEGEAAKVREVIMAELETITQSVTYKNPLYKGTLKLLGSSQDNTRLFAPDEFDVNLVTSQSQVKINIFELESSEAMAKGHKLTIKADSDDPDFRKNLQGSVWKNTFYNLVCEVLRHHRFRCPCLSLVPPGVTRTQVGVAIQMAWQGSEFPLLLVGVDLVPAIAVPWPVDVPKPYLTPSPIEEQTLSLTNIQEDEWRFSFAATEAAVLANLWPEEKKVYMACKTLLSCFKTESWMPREVKNRYTWWDSRPWKIATPPGYALKNCFFRRLEEKRIHGEKWDDLTLVDVMTDVFRQMCYDFQRSGDDEPHLVPSKVMAYFGKEFERPKVGFGAPLIVAFLESSKGSKHEEAE